MKRTTLVHMVFQEEGTLNVQARMRQRLGTLDHFRKKMMADERVAMGKEAREQAPKKTRKYAFGVRAYFYENPGGLLVIDVISGGQHGWLTPLIVGGTEPHEIPKGGSAAQKAKGYPLRFYWENGPKGPGIYYYWRVWHPGTKPNDFMARALKVRYPHIKRSLKDVGMAVASLSRYTGP